MSEKITRKEFLKAIAAMGLSAAGISAFIQSCGGSGENKKIAESNFTCNDLTGLSQADIQTRQNLKYIDRTTFEDKYCSNCNFWIPPQGGQTKCGACKVVKGPIHPNGYCISWMAKMS